MLIPLIPIAVFCSVGFIASIVKIVGNRKEKALVGLSLQKADSQQRIETALIINNVEYVFLHGPDRAGIQDAAIEFCGMKGSDLGVTVETFKECVSFVVSALYQKYTGVESKNTTLAEIWVKQPLVDNKRLVDDTTTQQFDDIYGQSIEEVETSETEFSRLLAEQQNLNEVEISDTEEPAASPPQVLIEINGVSYVFAIPAEMTIDAASSKLALEFCASRMDSLGLPLVEPLQSAANAATNAAILESYCSEPLAAALYGEFSKLQTQTPA